MCCSKATRGNLPLGDVDGDEASCLGGTGEGAEGHKLASTSAVRSSDDPIMTFLATDRSTLPSDCVRSTSAVDDLDDKSDDKGRTEGLLLRGIVGNSPGMEDERDRAIDCLLLLEDPPIALFLSKNKRRFSFLRKATWEPMILLSPYS